jgi:GNAT superfamily N-acetyltransferase
MSRLRIVSGYLDKYPEVYATAFEWMADMVRNGYLTSVTFAKYNHFEAWMAGDKVVCFLISEDCNAYSGGKETRIKAAWTHPDYRRRGLYARLFKRLVRVKARKRVKYLRSGYHRKNLISAEMQAKRGSVIVEDLVPDDFVETRFCLKPYWPKSKVDARTKDVTTLDELLKEDEIWLRSVNESENSLASLSV